VQEALGLDTEDINLGIEDTINGRSEGKSSGYRSFPGSTENFNPWVGVNGELDGFWIQGYTDLLPEGPRGVKIGMSADEVLGLFMVMNPEAMETAKNLQAPSGEYISIYSDDSDGNRHSADISKTQNGNFRVTYDIQILELGVRHEFYCEFSPEGIVTDIQIEYNRN
jgi:hypothetical protein